MKTPASTMMIMQGPHPPDPSNLHHWISTTGDSDAPIAGRSGPANGSLTISVHQHDLMRGARITTDNRQADPTPRHEITPIFIFSSFNQLEALL